MNQVPLVTFMTSWNPISVIVTLVTLFGMGVIGYYVITGTAPAAWVVTMAGVGLGAMNLSLGGTLAAIHAASVRQESINFLHQVDGVRNGQTNSPGSN